MFFEPVQNFYAEIYFSVIFETRPSTIYISEGIPGMFF